MRTLILTIFCIILTELAAAAADAPGALSQAGKDATALIPAGEFVMGSLEGTSTALEETPRHKVYIDAFLMDTREVTNEKFAAFLNAVKAGADFETKRKMWVVIRTDLESPEKKDWWPTEIEYVDGKYKALKDLENLPVLSVSWYAAEAYCRWEGKRLPTEAEWEKAARGGLTGRDYPWGDVLPTDGVVFRKKWDNNLYPAPVEDVGYYHPNGYGLYDMAGNVAEWCADWYDPTYYKRSPLNNPQGRETGTTKVVRGGSWASNAQSIRVAFRNYSSPDRLNSGVGFRCVKDAGGK